MSIDKIQLKQEEIVGNEVILNDINPKTNTRSITDSSTGTPMDVTIDHIWQTINNKLSRIVNSVNGRTGVVVLNADDVGLGNVDNVPLADIKKWVINRLKAEFHNKRIKLFEDLHEAEEFISDNDESKRDSPYYSHHGYGNDKRGYIGYIYWDDSKSELKHTYMVIDTVGWTDNSVLYNETVNGKNYEGGGLGVHIWKYEDALKVYNESAGIKDDSGLMIDKSNVMPNVLFFPSAYQSHQNDDYMICKEDDPGYDKAPKAAINIMGIHNVSGSNVIYCRLNPRYEIKYRDIIICYFNLENEYINEETNELNDDISPSLVKRNPSIGIVRSAPTPDNKDKPYNIFFFPIRPPVTGFGIQNMLTHVNDGEHGITADTQISIKLANGKMEKDKSEELVNISGLQAFDNSTILPTYPEKHELPVGTRFTNFPSGPENVFENKSGKFENGEFEGLFITPDSSLMISPYKYFGPDVKNVKSYNKHISEIHSVGSIHSSLKHDYSYIEPIGSKKATNWNIDTLPYSDNSLVEGHPRALSDSSLLGINLLKIVRKSDDGQTMMFGNISGLRINKAFDQYSANVSKDWMKLNADFYGMTEAELDNYNPQRGRWLAWEHNSGGLSVNVGKFLEIEPKGYLEDKHSFYDGGKINVRIGKGLYDAPPLYDDDVYKYKDTDRSNRIEVKLAQENVLDFDDNDAIRVKANPDMGLYWNESNNFNLAVKIGDPLSSREKNDNIKIPYIPSNINTYGGLRFFNGYLALRLNNDQSKNNDGDVIRHGTRGLNIDDNNILGVNIDPNTSELGLNEQGQLIISEKIKKNQGLQIIDNSGESCFIYKPNPNKNPSFYKILKLGAGLKLVNGDPLEDAVIDDEESDIRTNIIDMINELSIMHLSMYLSTKTVEQMSTDEMESHSKFTDEHKESLTNSGFRELTISCGFTDIQTALVAAVAICKYESLDVILNTNKETDFEFGVVGKEGFIETKFKKIKDTYFSLYTTEPSALLTLEEFNKFAIVLEDILGKEIKRHVTQPVWGVLRSVGNTYAILNMMACCLAKAYNILPVEGTEKLSREACKEIYLDYIGTATDIYNWMVSENWFRTSGFIVFAETTVPSVKNRLNEKMTEIKITSPDDLKSELLILREIRNRPLNNITYQYIENIKLQTMIDVFNENLIKFSKSDLTYLISYKYDISERKVYDLFGETVESISQGMIDRIEGNSDIETYSFANVLDYFSIILSANDAEPIETNKSSIISYIKNNITFRGIMRYLNIIPNEEYMHTNYDEFISLKIGDISSDINKFIDEVNNTSSSYTIAIYLNTIKTANTGWLRGQGNEGSITVIDSFLEKYTLNSYKNKINEILNECKGTHLKILCDKYKLEVSADGSMKDKLITFFTVDAELSVCMDFVNNYIEIISSGTDGGDEPSQPDPPVDPEPDTNDSDKKPLSGMKIPYVGNFQVTQQYKGQEHDGLDLVGITSKEIHATVKGEVVHAGWENDYNHSQGFGQYVCIRGVDGNYYYYGHMSEIKVKYGQSVNICDVIGIEGNTGYSFGSHCHYCIRPTFSAGESLDVSKISGIPNVLGVYTAEDVVENV